MRRSRLRLSALLVAPTLAAAATWIACSSFDAAPSPPLEDGGPDAIVDSSPTDATSVDSPATDDGGDATAPCADAGVVAHVGCPVPIANGQLDPRHVLAVKGKLFWTNFGSKSNAGSVMSAQLDGTNASEFVSTTNGYHPKFLASHGSYVYWGEQGWPNETDAPGGVHRQLADGGAIETFASPYSPRGIAADDERAYWVTGLRLLHCRRPRRERWRAPPGTQGWHGNLRAPGVWSREAARHRRGRWICLLDDPRRRSRLAAAAALTRESAHLRPRRQRCLGNTNAAGMRSDPTCAATAGDDRPRRRLTSRASSRCSSRCAMKRRWPPLASHGAHGNPRSDGSSGWLIVRCADMGTELRLVFEGAVDASDLDRILRTHPRFTDFDARHGSYNFRLHGAAPSMPHAEARIEPSAVYYCGYADDGSILDSLRAALVARYRVVTLEDL